MKKSIKLTSLAAMFVLILSFNTAALANSSEDIYVKNSDDDLNVVIENNNVTEIQPGLATDPDITIFGTNPPTSSSVKNLSLGGQLDFSGEADYSDLYTNSYFTGKSQYQITAKNLHSGEPLKIYLYKSGNPIAVDSWSIGPGYTLGAGPAGLDKSAKYYLKFAAPSKFSGNVK